jgi:hypothetical protein
MILNDFPNYRNLNTTHRGQLAPLPTWNDVILTSITWLSLSLIYIYTSYTDIDISITFLC